MSSKNVQIQSTQNTHFLSPRQAAQAVGVSESSLKRWCDKGEIPVIKTAGGHRRIDRRAIVRYLRQRGIEAKQPDLLGLPAGARLEARAQNEVLPQVVDALITGNETQLLSVLTGLYLAKLSLAQVADDFIRPAFEAIGDRWACDELEVYQEHRAVVVAQTALHQISTYIEEPAQDAPIAISATLSGDPYQLPITLIEMILRDSGWQATSLGPNHPVESLCAAFERLRPRLACINVSAIHDEERLVADMQTLYELAGKHGIALAIGGASLDSELRRRLSYTAHCESMAELVSLARGLEPGLRAELER